MNHRIIIGILFAPFRHEVWSRFKRKSNSVLSSLISQFFVSWNDRSSREFHGSPYLLWILHNDQMSKTICKSENNRGKIQIMGDIVDLCKAGIRKTHIMYKGNLSYEQINRYLYELLEKELIIQNLDDGVLTYRATEKGRSFLQYYNMMLSILDEKVVSMSPVDKLT
ncbi:MAG: winged helix-turn-helix domain-containing protein [Nitrososphaeraceae archaeon]